MSVIDDIARAELSQVGYTEQPAGSNRTKYAAELDTVEHKTWSRQGSPWCGTFQDWAFRQQGALAALPVSNFYTPSAAAWYKRNGRWTRTAPRVGDLAYRATGGGHVGFVREVKGGMVLTSEGNTSPTNVGDPYDGGTVAAHWRSIAWWDDGYGQPEYELVQPAHTPQGVPIVSATFIQFQAPGAPAPHPAVFVSADTAILTWVKTPEDLARKVVLSGWNKPVHIVNSKADFDIWGVLYGDLPADWPPADFR